MKKTSCKIGMLIPVLFLFLSGCLDFERWDVTYKVAGDLSGQMTLQVDRIHSNEAALDKQKNEMRDFYDDFSNMMKNFRKDSGFDRMRARLSGKTSTQCSGIVQAHFQELNSQALGLVDEGFMVTRENGKVRFELPKAAENLGTSTTGSFTLVFEGVLEAHNAHRVDKTTGALTWDLSKIKDTGVSFTLTAN